jgi:H/ACA ribonucleoprotein complex subunit 4
MVTEVVNKKKEEQEEHIIKPQATTPAVDTSEWPLLLKNYDNRK